MKKVGFIFFVFIIFSCTLSYILGVSANEFDVWNYHLYSPYALLNGRIGYDIMPAGVRSYFNPLLDIPYYLMIKYLNNYGGLVSILQGLYYAFFACSLYLLNSIFLPKQKFLNVLAVILSMSGVFFVSECGATFNDLQPATLIVLSLYFLLRKYTEKNFLISGFLCGIAVGLKLTMIPFVVAFILVLLVGASRFGYKKIGLFLSFLFLGSFLSGGIWYLYIWKVFKNPVFPYFNEIFRSEYYGFINLLSEDFNRYKQGLFVETYFKYPFLVCTELLKTEPKYRCFDLRIPSLFVLMLLTLVKSVVLKKISYKLELLIFWSAISYGIWIVMYSNFRYLLPILALVGLFMILGIKFFVKNKLVQKILAISLIIFLLYTSKYPHIRKSRTIPLNKPIYQTKIYPNLADKSLVLLASHATVGVALWQNPNVRYAQIVLPNDYKRFKHWSQHIDVDYVYSEYYYKLVNDLITAHRGNTYIVYLSGLYDFESVMYRDVLQSYLGHSPIYSECVELTKSPLGGHIMCKVD